MSVAIACPSCGHKASEYFIKCPKCGKNLYIKEVKQNVKTV